MLAHIAFRGERDGVRVVRGEGRAQNDNNKGGVQFPVTVTISD